MIILTESFIGIVLFTIIIISLTLKNPLASIGDYPPEIKKRCEELNIIPTTKKTYSKKDIIRKTIALIVYAIIFAIIINRFNGANSFMAGFINSYIIWLIIDWYDAFVLDCIWFCHSKRVRIPGTEDMKEYKNYWFHIKQSLIGMILGIPACILVGMLVLIF